MHLENQTGLNHDCSATFAGYSLKITLLIQAFNQTHPTIQAGRLGILGVFLGLHLVPVEQASLFFGESSQRRDIFWRYCIDMKRWEVYLRIFILYLWLPVVSSNLSISTFCNKDSHVMKNARWSCRRRNRLPCSSCGETRKHCFWPRVFSRIYTGARHSWDILMADFYLDSRGLRLDNLNLFQIYIIFPA